MRGIWLVAVFSFSTGCPARQNVPCSEDSNCDLGAGGVCRSGPTSSWCAYPDPECQSGYRFSDFDVGDGVAAQCVGGDACSADASCDVAAPVCDAKTKTCRGCRVDNECGSTVCDVGEGACVAESVIAYAMPGGSETAECQRVQPCSISRAIVVAKQQGKTVRLLEGVYATPIELGSPNVTPIQIVATGATLTSFTGVSISNGANVVIRGLHATGANFALQCAGAAARAKVTFNDGKLIAATSSSNLVAAGNCEVKMTNVEFSINDSTGTSLALTSDTTFEGDRLHLFGQQLSSVGMLGERVTLKITNSVLENLSVIFATNDQSTASAARFAFNTIVMKEAPIDCTPGSGTQARLFENNIIVAPTLTAAVDGTACVLSKNVLSPQPNAMAGNIIADPQFVDAAARNFKVKSSSPAVDAALPSPKIFTDHDYDGRARPVGNGADIGAYEQ